MGQGFGVPGDHPKIRCRSIPDPPGRVSDPAFMRLVTLFAFWWSDGVDGNIPLSGQVMAKRTRTRMREVKKTTRRRETDKKNAWTGSTTRKTPSVAKDASQDKFDLPRGG